MWSQLLLLVRHENRQALCPQLYRANKNRRDHFWTWVATKRTWTFQRFLTCTTQTTSRDVSVSSSSKSKSTLTTYVYVHTSLNFVIYTLAKLLDRQYLIRSLNTLGKSQVLLIWGGELHASGLWERALKKDVKRVGETEIGYGKSGTLDAVVRQNPWSQDDLQQWPNPWQGD